LMKIDSMSDASHKELAVEWARMKGLESNYVVRTFNFCSEPNQLMTISEYMEGNLSDILKKGEIPWAKKFLMAKEIASGLLFLHNRQIQHGDLKPSNILIDRDGHCKIADFGLSIVKREYTLLSHHNIESNASETLPYMAPELLKGSVARYSARSDIYALGVVLWEIATQIRPFAKHKDPRIVRNLIINGKMEDLPATVPVSYRKMVTRCCKFDPRDRLSVERVISILDSLLNPKSPPKKTFSRFFTKCIHVEATPVSEGTGQDV